jgi:hypothetical protein
MRHTDLNLARLAEAFTEVKPNADGPSVSSAVLVAVATGHDGRQNERLRREDVTPSTLT